MYVVSVSQARSRVTSIGSGRIARPAAELAAYPASCPHTLVSREPDGVVRHRGRPPAQRPRRAAGNKNAALPIIAACLLTDEPVTLANVPRILDVETMLELVADTRRRGRAAGPDEVRIHAAETPRHELDEELCRRIRASILLAGPLLARCGRAVVPPPGGDVIGRRRLDTHMHAFEQLGADVAGRPALRHARRAALAARRSSSTRRP